MSKTDCIIQCKMLAKLPMVRLIATVQTLYYMILHSTTDYVLQSLNCLIDNIYTKGTDYGASSLGRYHYRGMDYLSVRNIKT